MKPRWIDLFTILVAAALLLAPTVSVAAQDELPPVPQPALPAVLSDNAPQFAVEDQELASAGLSFADGLYVMPADALRTPAAGEMNAAAAVFSSPDAFGYRYQRRNLDWIDATSGRLLSDTGVQKIDLPFSFSFYGHPYDRVYLMLGGLLTFTSPIISPLQGMLGKAAFPNAAIAPYWTPLDFSTTNTLENQGVYILDGGETPNRWVAIEWHNGLDPLNNGSRYTFEAILFENGEIAFQYLDMVYEQQYTCGTSGIEDRSGVTSKTILKFCRKHNSSSAYWIVPPKSANFWYSPASYSGLAGAGETIYHHIRIENTGSLGPDTFDLSVSSKWPWKILDGTTLAPLTDTDGDKRVDTGPVDPGTIFDVAVAITPPQNTAVGKRSVASLRILSSINPRKVRVASILTAVPTNFAQYIEPWEGDDAAQLITFSPTGHSGFNIASTPNWFAGGIVENTAARLFHFDIKSGCNHYDEGGFCDVWIEEPVLNVFETDGTPVSTEVKIHDLSSEVIETTISDVRAAPATNGNVGFAWVIQQDNIENVYFAVVDTDGNIVTSPVALTDNSVTGLYTYAGFSISAIGNDQYVIGWIGSSDLNPGIVQYVVVNADGSLVTGPVTLSETTLEDPYITHLSALQTTTLANGNAIIAWGRTVYHLTNPMKMKVATSIDYTVVGSGGETVKRAWVSIGAVLQTLSLDVAQMSGGEIILAWSAIAGNIASGNFSLKNSYIILNGTSYKKTRGPMTLPNGGANLSVTTDQRNHAILTWDACPELTTIFYCGERLMYALVGKGGSLITPAMVYKTYPMDYDGEQWGAYMSGTGGYGNTTFTLP
jgi:hypothetical protein